jgi:hypothetical protein
MVCLQPDYEKFITDSCFQGTSIYFTIYTHYNTETENVFQVYYPSPTDFIHIVSTLYKYIKDIVSIQTQIAAYYCI